MKKKIICLFFAVLILLLSFPLGVFATDEQVINEWKNLGETSIEYDFEFVFAGRYKLVDFKEDKSNQTMSLISVMESRGGENNYPELYLYIYNPSMIEIDKESSYNNLHLSVYNGANDTNENNYEKRQIELVQFYGDTLNKELSTNAIILKYRLPNVSTYSSSGTHCYNLVEFELLKTGGESAQNYIVAKKYSFTFKTVEETNYTYVTCDEDDINVLQTDAYHTFYRVNSEGVNKYSDIQSVYFAVPNVLIESYGNLWSMKCEWLAHHTKNALVTKDATMAARFEKWIHKDTYSKEFDYSLVYGDVSFYGSVYPFGYNVERMSEYHNTFNDSMVGWRGGYAYDYDEIDPMGFDFSAPIESIYDYQLKLTFQSDNIDSYEEKIVDGEDILSYIYGHKIVQDGELVWDDSLLRLTEICKETFVVNKTSSYVPNKINVFETCNGWSAFWNGLYYDTKTEETLTINTFQQIDIDDLRSLESTKFADKYFVNKEDVRCGGKNCGSCLECRVFDEKNKDCSWFLLRYDVTEFNSYDALICDNTNGTTEKACVFNCGVIEGFDIIDVTFEDIDEKGKSVYHTFPIGRAPTNFAVDAWSPENTPTIGELTQDNWFTRFIDWINKTLVPILKVVLIVISVLIVWRIVSPFIPQRQKIKIEQRKDKHKDEK